MKRDQEDEDLAYLEAKLGLTKSGAKKRLASELADDGLGGTLFMLRVRSCAVVCGRVRAMTNAIACRAAGGPFRHGL